MCFKMRRASTHDFTIVEEDEIKDQDFFFTFHSQQKKTVQVGHFEKLAGNPITSFLPYCSAITEIAPQMDIK